MGGNDQGEVEEGQGGDGHCVEEGTEPKVEERKADAQFRAGT